MISIVNSQSNCGERADACKGAPVVVMSAGTYQLQAGYSSVEPKPPKICLPPFNLSCVPQQPLPKPSVKCIKYDDVVVNKSSDMQFSTCRIVVIENVTHHQHNKKVIITVNRNHLHTQRIITKDNNYHHFNTEYTVKVNDIHTQRVETCSAQGKTHNDYKQSVSVDCAKCLVEPAQQGESNCCDEAQTNCCDETADKQTGNDDFIFAQEE